jgi:HTH-type transcriptional regulator/antitoxin HigA
MKFEPDWASPPGATIKRVLALREIPFDDFANCLGLDNLELLDLFDGKIRITTQIARILAENIGSSADFWLRRDRIYQEEVSRLTATKKSLAMDEWKRRMPLRSMREFGWVSNSNRSDPTLEILAFFGCETIPSWQERYAGGLGEIAFRTTFAFEDNPYATLVWLRAGERQVELMDLPTFDKEGFLESLSIVKKISAYKHPSSFLSRLRSVCHRYGVALTTARAPVGCRASGASWITESGNPVIHLSFRHRSDDHFWFTFFHEAAHVVLHGHNHIDLQGRDPSILIKQEDETDANSFAQRLLLSDALQERLSRRKLTTRTIISAAKESGISAGVIVGQLEKMRMIKPGQFSFLKRRYRWADEPFIPLLLNP